MTRGWLPIVGLLLLITAAAGAAPSDSFTTGSGVRGNLPRQHRNYNEIKNALRNIDRTVMKMLRKTPGENQAELLIEFSDAPDLTFQIASRTNKPVIRLSSNYNLWKEDFAIQTKLLAALYLTKCGYMLRQESDLEKIPYWITTGTYEYIRRRQAQENDLLETSNYPEIHALAVAGGEIVPEDIVSAKIRPDDGDAFVLYSEAAEFLLIICNHISTENNRVIEQLVIAGIKGKLSGTDAFYQGAGPVLMLKLPLESKSEQAKVSREKIRAWFWNTLKFKTVNYFYPQSTENLEKAFKYVCGNYEYRKRNPDGTVTGAECKLDELWKCWGSITNRPAVLDQIRRRMAPIIQASTSDFISVMLRLDKLLKQLPIADEAYLKFIADNEKLDYEQQLTEICNAYAETCRRYREVEAWLRQVEKKQLPPENCFFYEFRALRQHEQNNRKLWPKANKTLDRLEKEYFTE